MEKNMEIEKKNEKKKLLFLVGKPMCFMSHIVLQRIQNVMSWLVPYCHVDSRRAKQKSPHELYNLFSL